MRTCLFLCLTVVVCSSGLSAEQPNIIYILADDAAMAISVVTVVLSCLLPISTVWRPKECVSLDTMPAARFVLRLAAC